MSLKEIYDKLVTLDIPVAYYKFNKPQSLPFCVYFEYGTEIKGADNYNLYREAEIRIELYYKAKSPELEHKIEALFRDRELEKTADSYIKEEDMFLTAYTFTTYEPIEEDL